MDRRPDIVAAVGRMTSPDEVRREVQHLPEYLRAGESVQRLAAGVYGVGTGLLAVTDRRVIVLREGRAGQASEGFPFEQIRGLDWAATTAEHATITISDPTRTTEFTQVAPADAAELVGFVRSVLQPPVAPAPGPPAGAPGTPAGGSIGNKFTAPPAAVTPGVGGVESSGGVRRGRWTLGEVPVSQLVGAAPEVADRAAPEGAAEGQASVDGVAADSSASASAVTAAQGASTVDPADAPDAPSGTDAAEPAAEAAAARDSAAPEDAGAAATRRPRFWRRSRTP